MNSVCSQTPVRFPHQFAGSRSLASMLPSLLATGLLTLVLTAVLRLLWAGYQPDFPGAWMEAWLTAWPIAFPLAYLGTFITTKLMRRRAHQVSAVNNRGLHAGDILGVSERVSRQNRLKRRSLTSSPDIH